MGRKITHTCDALMPSCPHALMPSCPHALMPSLPLQVRRCFAGQFAVEGLALELVSGLPACPPDRPPARLRARVRVRVNDLLTNCTAPSETTLSMRKHMPSLHLWLPYRTL